MKLYICEKPKTAKQLVAALGGTFRKISPHGNTVLAGHYEGGDALVTYLRGHVFALLEPQDINPQLGVWRLQDLPILHRDSKWKPNPEYTLQIEHITSLYARVSEVIIATDADQEGQVIGQVFVEETGWKGSLLRLWTNTWEEASLRKKLASIRSNTDFQGFYSAGVARVICDQAVGINFTRLYTKIAQQKGHDMVANSGRVRSAALAIAVDHEAMVNGHSANLYYTLSASLKSSPPIIAKLNVPESAAPDGQHCFDRALMQSFHDSVVNEQKATVLSVRNNENKLNPPAPFSLNTLAQYCAEHFEMMPKAVLETAQKLYELGCITYPRTDSTSYEPDVLTMAPAIAAALHKLGGVFSGAQEHINIRLPQPVFHLQEENSHGAICVESATPDLNALNADERNIYEAIALRFLAQFSQPFVSITQKIDFGIAALSFSAESTTVKSLGWASFLPKNTESSDALPTLSTHDVLAVGGIVMEEKKTKSPPRLTVSKFQSILEDCTHLLSPKVRERIGKGQLGTSATQGTFLDELIKQRALQIQDKKYVVSTKRGRDLRAFLPNVITSPDLTSLWEIHFRAIRAGQETKEQFLDSVFSWLENEIPKLKAIPYTKSPTMTPCELCGSAMIRRNSKNDETLYFWVCTNSESCDNFVGDHKGEPIALLPGHGETCGTCSKKVYTRIKKSEKHQKEPERYLSCGTKQCKGEAIRNGR